MNENLFDDLDIEKGNTHVPNGTMENPMDAGPVFEKKIADKGGIDLQVLGIGTDGHIGFNEPTSSIRSRTRLKTLTKQTVEDNSRFFSPDEFQPKLAITMELERFWKPGYSSHCHRRKQGRSSSRYDRGPNCRNLSSLCPADARTGNRYS